MKSNLQDICYRGRRRPSKLSFNFKLSLLSTIIIAGPKIIGALFLKMRNYSNAASPFVFLAIIND